MRPGRGLNVSISCAVSEKGNAQQFTPSDRLQETPLFSENHAVVECQAEILPRFLIRFELCAVRLVGREAVESDQAPANVIGAFVRHEITEQVTAATGNDASPVLRVLAEILDLVRINLITDEYDNLHGPSRRGPDGFCRHSPR